MPVLPVGAPVPAPAPAPVASPGRSFAALLESKTPLRPPGAPPDAPAPSALSALSALASVERAQARLDSVLAAARSGKTFTAAELIGLQAETYRCVQTVDLATRLVEQGAQSVKQAVNTQV